MSPFPFTLEQCVLYVLQNKELTLFSDWFDKRMEINQKRLKNLHKVCTAHRNEFDFEFEKRQQFVWVDKLQIMGCFIEKVGSTSLRNTFKDLQLTLGTIVIFTINSS